MTERICCKTMLCPCASAGSADAFVLSNVTLSLMTLLVTVRLTVRTVKPDLPVPSWRSSTRRRLRLPG